MNMRNLPLVALFSALALPAFADGDVAAGEEQFNRQCVACHVVRNEAGDILAGRNAKSGPNLYGLAGGPVGAQDGFRYGDSLLEAAEAGMVWDEESFVAYVQDPTDWLRTTLDDRRARSKMAYKVRDEQQAADIYDYIASLE
jgi:cytochrome c|tara:strand:+ start:212 stop:637 length:426 start_codon:yes stop_codon:yes gene_type:complete